MQKYDYFLKKKECILYFYATFSLLRIFWKLCEIKIVLDSSPEWKGNDSSRSRGLCR